MISGINARVSIVNGVSARRVVKVSSRRATLLEELGLSGRVVGLGEAGVAVGDDVEGDGGDDERERSRAIEKRLWANEMGRICPIAK